MNDAINFASITNFSPLRIDRVTCMCHFRLETFSNESRQLRENVISLSKLGTGIILAET